MAKKTVFVAGLVLAMVGLVGVNPAQAEVADGWDYRSLALSGTYQPLVGQFAGDLAEDILWYAPGTAPDSLWIGNAGQRGASAFTRVPLTINGTYKPVVGDFFGDEYSDIIWYAAGSAADSAWVSEDVPGLFARRPLTIGGTFRPSVLEDYSGAGRKDDVLWYAPGTAKDYLWQLDDTGSGTYKSVPLSINGTYQVIVGDWDADGLGDLVLYAPGSPTDYRWSAKVDGTFAQTSFAVNRTYEPVTILQEDGDGILWWADGPASEVYWARSGSAFKSVAIQSEFVAGSVTTAGLGGAIVTVPDDFDSIFLGDQTSGAWDGLAGISHDKTTQRPLVGDYDDDGFIDVLWYGRGSLSDELWYTAPSPTRGLEGSRVSPDRGPAAR